MKKKLILDNVKYNIIFISMGMIISWVVAMNADLPDSSNHGGFIPLIYPPITGLFFLIIYFISRAFVEKFNWIISIVGVDYCLYWSVEFYLSYL